MPKPIVLSAPAPRSLDLIFTPAARARLHETYEVMECPGDLLDTLPDAVLRYARYILGQPPVTAPVLARLAALRAVLNVESNLIDNMPYADLFQRGIHVVTTGAVFARPVAELGLALALDLLRGVTEADLAFRQRRELWGGDGNTGARLLTGAEVGIIGFGDLGRSLREVLTGFRPVLRAFDPWLPPSLLAEAGVVPADLDTVLGQSDVVFVTAAVTSENRGFLNADAFSRMRPGAAFILLSRADVVDFDALMAAVAAGHITAASDVFPQEPLAPDHPVRALKGFLRSAHRAGALDVAFKQMGDMVLEDMALMDRGLPPMRCKRAERETVARMRSRPVTRN
ncbi:MAG: hydroxyacid dehydrogenase [Rhodobacteraceae bacterium]|nr:hydroxyacid dehydrogenase [Paracoccaceae bacterium]